MDVQKTVAAAGAAVTTFLVVGAATVEAVTATVGGDIGPGILGVFAGVVAAMLAAWAVGGRWARLDRRARSVLVGYAAFGLTLVGLAFLSYVNAPGVDAYLGVGRNLVVAAAAAVLAAAAAHRSGATGSNAAD